MALDYPNTPTVGQVFGKWTWSGTAWVLTPVPATLVGTVTWYREGTPPTSGANGETWYQPSTNTLFVLEAGVWTPVTSPSTGGFTFVQDTAPTPTKAGDNWFDTSDGASGGTSWVAISEVPGSAGPLNWVQFAPGSAAPVAGMTKTYKGSVSGTGGIVGSTKYTVPVVVTVLDVRPADTLFLSYRHDWQHTSGQGMSVISLVNGAAFSTQITGPSSAAVPISFTTNDLHAGGLTGSVTVGFQIGEWYGSSVVTSYHEVRVLHIRG